MKIPTFYSDRYYANTSTASMRKLPIVAKQADQAGYVDIQEPSEPAGLVDKLKKFHDPEYVDAFDQGEGILAMSNGWDWTPEIRDGVFQINQGQLDAAEVALEKGIAANVAQGFHHAGIVSGSGFCTFNGLALVASEFPGKKVFVLDCDEHGGNGTAEFTDYMENLAQVTINGSPFGVQENERTVSITLPRVMERFELYLEALEMGFEGIDAFKPDLVIYQAGADPHHEDPLGSLDMTTWQLLERDRYVFQETRKRGIPILFVLAGGYQRPIETKLAPLHVNTFMAASEVYANN